MVVLLFKCLRNLHADFHGDGTSLHSHQHWIFFSILTKILCAFVFNNNHSDKGEVESQRLKMVYMFAGHLCCLQREPCAHFMTLFLAVWGFFFPYVLDPSPLSEVAGKNFLSFCWLSVHSASRLLASKCLAIQFVNSWSCFCSIGVLLRKFYHAWVMKDFPLVSL